MFLSTTLMLLMIIATLIYLYWREKRKHHRQIERLLDDIQQKQALRADKLIQQFCKDYGLAENDAENLAKQLIISEKDFFTEAGRTISATAMY